MFGTELSWEFMRDLGLVVFAAGGRLLPSDLASAKFCFESSVALMTTIGDAMMLAGACLAVTAMGIGYLMPAGNP
jgi:hypothetical protein